jgi:hypothetical protein
MVPVFQDTIRRFVNNSSEMKKLAARNFEDLLIVRLMFLVSSVYHTQAHSITQCILPVFEGLLPLNACHQVSKEERIILNLLFDFATFHAFVKLRLHTDTILGFFDQATESFLKHVWSFVRDVCPRYQTKPLPKEEAVCQRRKQAEKQKKAINKRAGKQPSTSGNESAAMTTKRKRGGDLNDEGNTDSESPSKKSKTSVIDVPTGNNTARRKPFNVMTPKWHSMKHYPRALRTYGPTDNYSTLIVSTE